MPGYVEGLDDLHRKWTNTFCLADGKLALVHEFGMTMHEGSPTPYAHVSYSESDREGKKILIKEGTLQTPGIDSMFVNTGDLEKEPKAPNIACVLYERSPKRQFQRGLTRANTKLSTPISRFYGIYHKRNQPNWEHALSWHLMRRLLSPVYPSLSDALSKLNKFECVAISPMFALCLSNIAPDRALLASIFGFVGEVKGNNIYVRHLAALQEIRDFVTRTRQHIVVEVCNA